MKRGTTLNSGARFLPRLSLLALLGIAPLLSRAQVDHSSKWLSATNLTYGLVDLDGFLPGGYAFCRWGNYMDYNSVGTVNMTFRSMTAPPYNNSNTDLFITGGSVLGSRGNNLQRVTYNNQPFPSNAVWTSPRGSLPGGIEFSASNNVLELYRYQHFKNQLVDRLTGTALPSTARKLVILIHGCNQSGLSDQITTLATPEFLSLDTALRLALEKTDWALVGYHWEIDSETGGLGITNAITNATAAAETGNLHGQHLGELLGKGFPNLEKVQLIAHSAGAWVARSAARYILKDLPNCAVQVTFLDPFMPTALFPSPNSVLGRSIMDAFDSVEGNPQLKTLENYYADEVDFLGGVWSYGTQETFAWDRFSDRNIRVDGPFGSPTYSSHAGPILFYGDTVSATLPGKIPWPSLASFDIRPNSLLRKGWTRSLFYNEPLILQNPASQTANVGSDITLSAVASSRNATATDSIPTYQWRRNGVVVPGATSSNLRIPLAQASDAGSYTVTASNFAGSTTSAAATLSVFSPLAITSQPQAHALVAGTNLTLNVSVTGGAGALTYQWRFNGESLPNGSNSTYVASNIGLSFTGTFDVVVSDGVSTVTSAPAAITVTPAVVTLAIAIQPASQSVTAGNGVTLTVGATGTPPFTYQWQKNGLAVPGVTSATLNLTSAQSADSGSYTVTITNSAGSVTSAAATLNVTSPPSIATQPSNQSVIAGGSATLSVGAAGTPPFSYQWQKNGIAVPGATNATLSFASAQVTDAGSYTVTITNSAGSFSSAAATLAVNFSRLSNLSILTALNAPGDAFTVGTVLGGTGTSGPKALLVRAAGPSLAQLGVGGVLADPRLNVFSGQTAIASNDNWGGTAALATAFNQVGAFAYASSTSRDAAVLNPAISAGGYTVQISGVGGATGNVIAEIYDATPPSTFTSTIPRLINLSVLKRLSVGEILTAGFVVVGTTTKQVLIRAIGPTLAVPPFNVPVVMADPKLDLFSGRTVISSNDNWGGGTALAAAFANVGAFTLINGVTSRDAALLVTLAPGNYTAQVTGVNGSAGSVLIEVYEVP